jgi:hypothetical protein
VDNCNSGYIFSIQSELGFIILHGVLCAGNIHHQRKKIKSRDFDTTWKVTLIVSTLVIMGLNKNMGPQSPSPKHLPLHHLDDVHFCKNHSFDAHFRKQLATGCISGPQIKPMQCKHHIPQHTEGHTQGTCRRNAIRRGGLDSLLFG